MRMSLVLFMFLSAGCASQASATAPVALPLASATPSARVWKVPKNFRGLTVPVEATAFAGQEGDYVDIITTADFGDEKKSDIRAVTLLQNVFVLSVGSNRPGIDAIGLMPVT